MNPSESIRVDPWFSSWRAEILKEFTAGVARLTLVADPDGLLLEEGVLEGIRKRGFELIPFEDPVAFRFAYESKFRSRWDREKVGGAKCEVRENDDAIAPCTTHIARQSTPDLVVVLHSGPEDLEKLPYDLLQVGRRLHFSLGDLFPNLSYPVVAALDRADLDALFDAQAKYAPGPLGDNATKDFVLRHVFEIAPELIKEPKDLLRVLLRRHYRGQRIPAILDERFIQVLRHQSAGQTIWTAAGRPEGGQTRDGEHQNGLFEDWPLEAIIPDAQAFFAFLQERWPVFLDWLANPNDDAVLEHPSRYGFEFPGPTLLPFNHDDVRIYIDNLFFEGLLQPVAHEKSQSFASTWVAYGIKASREENRRRRLEGLLDAVEKTIPTVESRHGEWLHFAYRWAKLKVVSAEDWVMSGERGDWQERIEELNRRVDARFLEWVTRHYASLINLPATNPVMLHHLPRFFAHSMLSTQRSKLAFLLVDGMSCDQWLTLKEVLTEQLPELRFRENAVFAWIPTITSVSRQAAFAGKPPIYFPASIHTTDKEPGLWTQFWVDQGLHANEVAYAKGLGDLSAPARARRAGGCNAQAGGDLDEVSELLSRPGLRVVGLVIDKVDRIMHGMELGAAGMLGQVRQWARQGFMRDLLGLLHTQGFQVYLASDHGNIEAQGVGRPREGAVADLRGERVRVYSDPRLRAQIKERFPESLEWPPVGLPEDYLALIAPPRAAFVRAGETLIGHGGISVEELLVPLVRIDRRD